MLHAYLGGLPAFLLYFVGGICFLALFAFVYSRVTQHDEIALLRGGTNQAAAPALIGALIGFALPLSKSIAQSANFLDFVVWSVIAFAVQILAYFAARAVMPDLTKRIEANDMWAGVWVGGAAIVFGMINSASMTYTP
jgi:putative membrane protein